MPKKITIDKGTEETELTEREEQIYESGYDDGREVATKYYIFGPRGKGIIDMC